MWKGADDALDEQPAASIHTDKSVSVEAITSNRFAIVILRKRVRPWHLARRVFKCRITAAAVRQCSRDVEMAKFFVLHRQGTDVFSLSRR